MNRVISCESTHPNILELQREPLITQLIEWRDVHGCSWEDPTIDMFELRAYCLWIRLCRRSSQYVEGEHGEICRGVRGTPRVSEAYLSLIRRKPALVEAVSTSETEFRAVAELMAKAKNPLISLGLLGLRDTTAATCVMATEHRSGREAVGLYPVIYCGDGHSKYQAPAPPVVIHEEDGAGVHGDDEMLGDMFREEEPELAQVRLRHMIEYMAQKDPSHHAFSMPLPEGAFQLLQVALRRAPAHLDLEALTDVGEAASAHPDGSLGQIGSNVFWTLVSSVPQRIIRPNAAGTADMKGQHVVNVHECWYLANDAMIAEVSLAPQQSDIGPAGLAIHDLTLEQRKQLLIWTSPRLQRCASLGNPRSATLTSPSCPPCCMRSTRVGVAGIVPSMLRLWSLKCLMRCSRRISRNVLHGISQIMGGASCGSG